MSLPESTQHSGDASKYHDLIMQQLRLTDETSTRLETKLESLANEVRTGNQQISTAHIAAVSTITERLNNYNLATETRLSTIETQFKNLDGSKVDNKWWISIIFSFIAVSGMVIGLLLKH